MKTDPFRTRHAPPAQVCENITIYADALDGALWWGRIFSNFQHMLGRHPAPLYATSAAAPPPSSTPAGDGSGEAPTAAAPAATTTEPPARQLLDVDIMDTTWLENNVHEARASEHDDERDDERSLLRVYGSHDDFSCVNMPRSPGFARRTLSNPPQPIALRKNNAS